MANQANSTRTAHPSRDKKLSACRTCGTAFRRKRGQRTVFCSWECYIASIPPFEERFWKWTDRKGPDECWPWLGSKARGYGMIAYKRRPLRAHRASYMIHNGPIPDGAFICHTCDNPSCVNPNHLYAGTAASNVRDMMERGRQRPGINSMKGEDAPTAKLTEDDVRAIRESPLSSYKAALIYGVSPTQIRNIRHRRNWRHI